MPTIELDFSVYCSCGNGMCNATKVESGRYGVSVTINPCEKCLEKAKAEGDSEGYERGYQDGLKNGKNEGGKDV